MRRRLLPGLLLAGLATACTVTPLPDPGLGDRPLTTVVYAADGTVIARWHAEENRRPVTYDDLPRSLVDAVVAVEDERFWEHRGVDLRAIGRALVADVAAGDVVQGGSTITQQYLKNVVLSADVGLDRKLREAVLALRLERGLDKERILEHYLNTVYFGAGAYGVGAAAETYFGKDVRSLELAESALLAGLIRAPTRADPYTHPDRALRRRRAVLDKMVALGWIAPDAAAAAAAEPLRLQDRTATRDRYPYFTAEVRRRLLREPALGATPEARARLLREGGLRIYTTLDPAAQDAAERAVASVLPDDGPAAALAALDPRTGHVLALVGGRDFYDPRDPVARFDLATRGRRQAGSAFKPFVLAAALEHGLRLDTVLPAGRTVTITTPSGPWTVENYAGETFPDLTLEEATVFSVNAVYARLIDLVGPRQVAAVAAAAGITTPLLPYHGLALGAQEVTVLDMASAYGTFAAGGTHVDPVFVTRIEDADGVDLYDEIPVVTEAVSRAVADDVTRALEEVVRRGTGIQAWIGRPVAGKTGTTQDDVDAWFVGYTAGLSAAVWVGYPRGSIPMEPPRTPFTVTGGTWPAWIWARFAATVLADLPSAPLPAVGHDGFVTVPIDTTTGLLAGPGCPTAHVHEIRLPADRVPAGVCGAPGTPVGAADAKGVPALVGFDLGEAGTRLGDRGLVAVVTWDAEADGPEGTVVAQDPAPGSALPAGPVRLTLAGRAPGTTMPALLGLPLPVVADRLTALAVPWDPVLLPEADPEQAAARRGLVWKQEPPAGAALPERVTVWVNP